MESADEVIHHWAEITIIISYRFCISAKTLLNACTIFPKSCLILYFRFYSISLIVKESFLLISKGRTQTNLSLLVSFSSKLKSSISFKIPFAHTYKGKFCTFYLNKYTCCDRKLSNLDKRNPIKISFHDTLFFVTSSLISLSLDNFL